MIAAVPSALALLAATPAAARTAPADAPAPATAPATSADEVVVTAQRRNQSQVVRAGQVGVLGDKPAQDVPFSIKSYDASLILNQQPLTLGQVLDNDPAIRTTYAFGNAAELYVVRGFPLFGEDIGLDGLFGILPRQLIAPELYQQVQVLNGASAFLFGALPGGSGVGGTVNLVPKRAGAVDVTRATANYSSDSHFGGSFDVGRRFADGRLGVRINAAFRSGDVAIDDEFRRAAVVGGALDFRGDAVRLFLDVAYQKQRVARLRPKVTVATATVPDVPRADANYAQAFSYTDLRDVFGSLRGEWDVADNAMLYAAIGARDGSEDGIYDGITVLDAATGAANGNALFVPRTDNNQSAQAGLRVRLGTAVTHEFNVGGSYLWQVNRNAYDFRYGPGFAGYATNLYATPQVALPASTLVGGDLDDPYPIARVRQGSAFASDTVGLFGGRVLLTGGLRLQTIDVRSYSYVDGTRAGRQYEDAVTPVAGIVVKPAAALSLFANRIEALQPGPTAPFSAFNPATGTTQPVSNAGTVFGAYRSTQYEVGGKLRFGALNASLALFTVAQPVGTVGSDPAAAGQARFDVDGRQRHRGIELGLDGELARGLRVIAGASLLDAKYRDTASGVYDGNRATGVPRYTANATLEWDLPFVRGLTLTGRVVQTGRQAIDQANTLTLPEWTRLDAGARFVAAVGSTPLTLRFNVDNLADNRYWASAFDSFSQAILQGQPRTYKASVSVDF